MLPETVSATWTWQCKHSTHRPSWSFALYCATAVQSAEDTASGQAALHLAAYLFYTHSFERARTILERNLRSDFGHGSSTTARLQTLLGFVLLEQQAQEVAELQDARELQQALKLFDTVLQQDHSDLEVNVNWQQ